MTTQPGGATSTTGEVLQPPAAAGAEVAPPPREPVTFKEVLRDRFLSAAIGGNHPEASSVVDTAIAQGMSSKAVYLEIIMPAQRRAADLQVAGTISFAQQRSATEIELAELGRLRPLLKRRRGIGKSIVVCSLEDDPHSLTGRILSDFLFMEGWEVEFMGGAVPEGALLDHVALRRPQVVAFAASSESTTVAHKALFQLLRGTQPIPRILLVGALVEQMGERTKELGADAYCQDVNVANEIARQLVGLPRPAASLPEYLKSLGERIQSIRKSQQMSQQDVALGSGLERAYISAIEHGKHNITLGAVMKLSDALRVPFEELLVGVPEESRR